MASLSKQGLRRTFSGKCDAAENVRGDHVWYHFSVGDTIYARTKVSHGQGDVPTSVAGRISRQVGLTQQQLADLVRCRLTADLFYDNLADVGPLTGQMGL